ncbi:MAG: hypothetical protein JST15_07005 [Bacteroidetes bacterium]|nr:hypothetical protein [Bacteroidota bacterium]
MKNTDNQTDKLKEAENDILKNPETNKFIATVHTLNHKDDVKKETAEDESISELNNESKTKYNMQNRNQPLKYIS